MGGVREYAVYYPALSRSNHRAGLRGDSIVNSMADILCCVIGFILARYLGFRWSLVLFVATGLVLLFWVRDNLTLNVLMLIYPIDAIKSWQMIH